MKTKTHFAFRVDIWDAGRRPLSPSRGRGAHNVRAFRMDTGRTFIAFTAAASSSRTLPCCRSLSDQAMRRRQKSVFFSSVGRLDCSQGYHRLWLPDCSGRKTEQCAERPLGEPSRGFGGYRLARYRFE
jgi:hypothetical protein